MSTLRVAAVQHDIVWNDRDANFERLAPKVAAAAGAGAGLVVLTETFSTGFGFDQAGFGETEGGPSAQFLAEMAKEHGVWVGGSCPEVADGAPDDDQRPSNTFVLTGPGGVTHRYRKIHPFSHAGEERHVRAGTDLVTVDVEGFRVSMFVCYDLRFADEFWQLAAGTDLYLVPANWPEKRRTHWMALLQARAIENQAYVVGVNRVGEGDNLTYSGDSRIVDPLGELLATASRTESILLADISTDHVAADPDALPLPPRPPLTPGLMKFRCPQDAETFTRSGGSGEGFGHQADEVAVVGLLLADLDEAEAVVERQRAVVARPQIDLEQEPWRVGAPLDLVVQRPAEPAALELGRDRDPVEVHEVVVALGEPAVVDAAVVGTGAEDEAEPGDDLAGWSSTASSIVATSAIDDSSTRWASWAASIVPTPGTPLWLMARTRSRSVGVSKRTGIGHEPTDSVDHRMSDPLISARKLVKRFGDFTAVDGIDVEVAPRRVVRIPRSERRGEVVDDADDRLRLARHRRRAADLRPRPGRRRTQDPGPDGRRPAERPARR